MTATLRPFDWRDLPVLHRYRAQGLCLDAALAVTRGPNLAPGVLLSYLSPATGIFTWICSNECDQQPLMGQMSHSSDETFARLTFLAPEGALESPSLSDLLEQLAQNAGSHGALNLLAEVDEKSIAFEPLRKAGFAIYARQSIWKFTENPNEIDPEIPWTAASSLDSFSIQALYHNVVPGLVQQIEPLSSKQINGMVCYYNDEIIGYVDLKYGSRGIWAQPFIHPDVKDVDSRLRDLLPSLPHQRGRTVYLCVRSYQSWLEPALNALEAHQGSLQAVLVKRLAIQQRFAKPFAIPQIDGQREVTTPITQSKQNGTSIPNATKP